MPSCRRRMRQGRVLHRNLPCLSGGSTNRRWETACSSGTCSSGKCVVTPDAGPPDGDAGGSAGSNAGGSAGTGGSGASGTAGSGVAGGMGGAPGSGGNSEAGAVGAAPAVTPASSDSGGCSCRAEPSGGSPGWPWIAASVIAVLGNMRRRRSHRAIQ